MTIRFPRLSAPLVRHPPIRPPWKNPAALIVAGIGLGATAFLGALLLGALQGYLVSLWDVDMSYAPHPGLKAMGTVAVYLLIYTFTFPIDLVLFLPLYFLALRQGRGGWIAASAIGGLAGTLRFLPFAEPTWAGTLGGLFFGAVFGTFYHTAARRIGQQ